MNTHTCFGCDCEVECRREEKDDSFSLYCDRCGHYKVEGLVLKLYEPNSMNQKMKEKLQKRLIKTKNAHNRIITTKQNMKKVKKDEVSSIVTLDETDINNVELWKVENVGGALKISLDDTREQ